MRSATVTPACASPLPAKRGRCSALWRRRLERGATTHMSATADHEGARVFETHRPRLVGLAYRMLGSRAEAEDVVQDAYLRWHGVDRNGIGEPRHYLGTVVTRLCLDRMKSASARREVYVGAWLPEPVVDESFDAMAASD